MAEIKQAGEEHGDKVVEALLQAVCDVTPEVPERYAASSKA